MKSRQSRILLMIKFLTIVEN